MNRPALFTIGCLVAVVVGCGDPTGPQADPISLETSASLLFGGTTSVSLEKTTNGQDADTPPGPTITPGDPVTWAYTVTNTGTEVLMNLTVTDDKEGDICIIPFLDPSDDYVCTATGTATAEPYVNEGTVTGSSIWAQTSASDLSHYNFDENGGGGTGKVVGIWIKPGSTTASINVRSKGRTPVAILSSEDFDATGVEPGTILAGGGVAPAHVAGDEDVNGDGLPDLVVHFKTQDLVEYFMTQDLMADVFREDGAELEITGETFEGEAFSGSVLILLTRGSSKKK